MDYTITQNEFAKISKRLQKLLPNTALSASQETMAKALGFRNYNEPILK